MILMPLRLLWAFLLWQLSSMQLRTNAGRDHQARVVGDTASDGTGAYASANWIGLTANATAPLAIDTVLTGEITSGTLIRDQAIYAHTNGTDTFTLTAVFTSDQTVTIEKVGVFNDPAAGTMAYESLLDTPVNLVSGDQVQITVTIEI